MKIVFFISQLGHGGAEGVVATLASELVDRGHEVVLVSHLKNQYYKVSNRVKLVDVRQWQYDTMRGFFFTRIYKKAANRFLDFYNIGMLLKQEKADLVISFLASWALTLAIVCKHRAPLVCAERNAMVYPHGRNNFFTKKIVYRMAYAVQVMSRYDKAWVRNMYKRVYPMPNPLRYEPLSRSVYDSIFDARKNILACGRIHPQKGFDKLISAFAIVAPDFPNWNLDICGFNDCDDYYKRLLDLIAKSNLRERVNFLGGRKDVDMVMQSHSIFCLSSQHEGFPNVLSEAMANGMACISFDIVTGPSEIINDSLDGIIVENQDVNELAVGLRKLIENKELRYDLGAHAIENIQRYKKENVVAKWESLFVKIINKYRRN